MVAIGLLILTLIIMASDVLAATRYVSTTGSDSHSCAASEDIATPKLTFASAVACLTPGDTLYIRGGTYPSDQRIDLMTPNISGTSSGWITIAGYPGERPTIKWFDPSSDATTGYGPFKAWGDRGYFIVENIIFDGALNQQDTRWQLRSGNHHFIIRNVEMKNFWGSPIIVRTSGSDITIQNCELHDQQDGVTSRHYGLYLNEGTNIVVENNHIYNNPGGGIHVFQGPMNNVTIRNNSVHHNGTADWASGGMIVSANPDATGGVPAIDNLQIYNNLVYKNGLLSPHANPSGIILAERVTGVKVYNNLFYGNKGYGILTQIGTGSFTGHPINATYQNNIVMANTIAQMLELGTGTTKTYNGCLSGDECGSSKITFATTTEPFVDAANDDYRLKQGTNPARDAGATVTTRPSPVGPPDVGAYEQGKVVSAVASDGIDVLVDTQLGSISPTTSIDGFLVECDGCTGTPVVQPGSLKAGTSSTVHLVISGITVPGACRITVLPTSNLTDGELIGGVAQGIDSVTDFLVGGTCANSGGVATPSGAIAYYKLNEGTGVIAGDETTNNFDALFPPQITWTTVYSGSGLRVPNDGAFHSLVVPFGASTNMATAAGATCAIVKPDATLAQKVVFSSGGNGANQRLYYGWATVGGELQWGIGIQGSGFTTGSEFPVTSALTSVCLTWSGGTATLWVNGVKGTQSGKSIKTYGSYVTVPSNFEYGGDGTNVTNSGGYDLDEIVFWSTLPSDGVLQAYHTDRFIPGAAATCYAQVAHQVQLSHLYGGAATNYGYLSAPVDVIAGGSAAVIFQIDCTGSAGSSISVVPYYADLQGGPFTSPVPLSAGGAGIGMYGSASAVALNAGTVSGNLVGALTNIPGVTVYLSNASQDILLAEDQSKVVRYLFTFGEIEGQTRCVALKQGGGTALAGGVTPSEGACFRIVPRAVMVP